MVHKSHSASFCDCGQRANGILAATERVSVLSRRRIFEAGLAATLAGLVPFAAAAADAGATTARIDPATALKRMMDGNARFVRSAMVSFDEDLAELRRGVVDTQTPFAAVLSCADSRIPVELVFDQSIGHVFVTRVAGNVATPEVIASLEYGAAVLGVSSIMVLAHESCGAVKAAAQGAAVPGQISALYAPLRASVARGGGDVEQIARYNALAQADILKNASPLLRGMLDQGTLSVVAAYYSLKTGEVTLLA